MDEILMRRLRHLQWLEANHAKDCQVRESNDALPAAGPAEVGVNGMSADGIRAREKRAGSPNAGKLPRGWRKEHWKTQQSMARDYAGVNTASKAEAISALEAYEIDGTLPPAA